MSSNNSENASITYLGIIGLVVLFFVIGCIHVGTWIVLAVINALFYGTFGWLDSFLQVFDGVPGGIDFFQWKILAFAIVVGFIRRIFSRSKT